MTQTKKPFYGWINCMLTVVTMMLMQTASSTGFYAVARELAGAYEAPTTLVYLGMTLHALANGLTNMVVGSFILKVGLRKSEYIGLAIMMASAVVIWLVPNVYVFIVAMIIMGLGVTCSLAVPVQTCITRWFERKRGLVFAIFGVCSGLAGTIMTPLITFLYTRSNYTVWPKIIIGFGIVSMILLLFTKESPEAIGQVKDGKIYTQEEIEAMGEKAKEKAARVAKFKNPETFTFKEALRTKQFWLCTLLFGFAQYVYIGMSSQGLNKLYDVFGPAQGAIIMGGMTFLGIFGRLFGPAITDYIDSRHVIWAGGLCYAVSMAIGCMESFPIWAAWLFVAGAGIGFGALNGAVSCTMSSYFGPKYYGQIFGLAQGIATVISSSANALNDLIRVNYGYTPLFMVLLAMSAFIFLVGMFIRMPHKKAA